MGGRVIVIDDEPAIRKSFELALEDVDCRLDTAESGKKGLEMIRDRAYDLVFLDLKMPEMSGIETLRELRKIDREVPVYIVTAFHGEYFQDLKALWTENYAFEVLQKPVGAEHIVAVTESVLNGPVTID